MCAGGGSDRFIFQPGSGNDTVEDFRHAQKDKVDLSAIGAITSFSDLVSNHLSEVAGNAVVTFGTETITFLGMREADFERSDFIL